MPDLGKYAVEVLSAYGVTTVILIVLTWASVARAARVRRELDRIESNNG